MLKRFLPLCFLMLTVPGIAAAPPAPALQVPALQQQIEALLAQAPKGSRFGLMVADEAGQVLVAINPDMRFMPASNTKLFTTAAALALLPGIDAPDRAGGAQVYLTPRGEGGLRDVVLYGRGDARMSSAPDCRIDCLVTLADAVAAHTRIVGDVIGDDSYFPDQRWSAGMSWNNLGDYSATAASALSLDANELTVRVSPGRAGDPAVIAAPAYPRITNTARTVAAELPISLAIEHTLNSQAFRLYGAIPAGSAEWRARIAIDDPAHYAAFTLADMLRARGVTITGKVAARHRPFGGADQFASRPTDQPDTPGSWGTPLAQLVPPPLMQTIAVTNKASQNQHAELLLRRIGRQHGGGAVDDGLMAARGTLIAAGIPADGFDLYDGSGMSTYNRVTPRAMLAVLRWGLTQRWGPDWLASFPVAGRDGTLQRRFIATPLEGRLMAKTGSLNATHALSGFVITASGRQLTFAFFANDVPEGPGAVAVMERALLAVATASGGLRAIVEP